MVKKLYIKESTTEQQGSINKLIRQLNAKIDELEGTYEECITEDFSTQTDYISSEDKNIIIDCFDNWDVIIVDDYMKDDEHKGVLYHDYVVETDEMDNDVLYELEADLKTLRNTYNINYFKEPNSNGINAKTFYFFHTI